MDMTQPVRLAEASDCNAVTQLVHDAYRHYIARMGCEPMPMLEDYAALIAQGLVQVVDHGGHVAGMLVLVREDAAMLLDNIAVSPAVKGQGIGRMLLMEAERQARAAGYGLIYLYTHVTMTENIALYQRVGYQETHRACVRGRHRVYMEKRLG